MKPFRTLSILIALVLLITSTVPAYAQLGDSDTSQIKVQNISGGTVSVTIQFISEGGTTYTPSYLKIDNSITNPFSLADGASKLIDVSDVPGLPYGRYSVLIASTGQVVANASVYGEGTEQYSGSYPGASAGATTIYIPTTSYNWYGWYSMISVMNVGNAATDVTVQITCSNTGAVGIVGELEKLGLAQNASVTWALKDVVPDGFTTGTECQGSAKITASQPLVAVNNNNKPGKGQTNAFESMASGSSTVYVPQLQSYYYGWISALNILKLDSGPTEVTVNYSDTEPSDTCNLTDATPSCQLMMHIEHTTPGRFSATITSSPANDLLVSVGSSRTGRFSGGYVGADSGSRSIAAPLVMKKYFNWNTFLNCQNVTGPSTTLNVAYEGYTPYDTTTSLGVGDSIQISAKNETFLPESGWNGSAVVTANHTDARIICMIGSSAGGMPIVGDWTLQYNATPK